MTHGCQLHQGGDCGGLARGVGRSGPSNHTAPWNASLNWQVRNTRARPTVVIVAAFVDADLSKDTHENKGVQTNVDVPEYPAPDNEEIS